MGSEGQNFARHIGLRSNDKQVDISSVVVPAGPIRAQKTNEEQAWARRPVFAFFVRVVAILGPAVSSFLLTFVLAGAYPPDRLGWNIWLWWSVLISIGLAALIATDNVARRLLPLATLFTLSLVFPDQAPSRFSTAMKTGTTRQLQRRIDELRLEGMADSDAGYATTMLEMVAALSVHDRLTRGHCERVRAYTDLLIEELGLDEEAASRLRWAALLHDVGKLFVPQHILTKEGRPTSAEWDSLKSHTWKGAELTEPLRPWLGDWHRSIGEHHERWDGDGYPGGLAGTDIHLGARIVAVADAYDVMTSTRSYKKPISAADARAEIARCAGSQFDPRVARAFLNIGLGRMRLALGPLGWLANIPAASSVAPVVQPAAMSVVAIASATVAVVSGGYVSETAAPPDAIAFTTDEPVASTTTELPPTTVPSTSLGSAPTTLQVPPTTRPDEEASSAPTAGPPTTASPATTTPTPPSTTTAPIAPPTTSAQAPSTSAATPPPTHAAAPLADDPAPADPPLAFAFSGTTPEDQPASFLLTAQAASGPVTFAVVTPPAVGSVSIEAAKAELDDDQALGIDNVAAQRAEAAATLNFTPGLDHVGVETFVFEVCAEDGQCAAATGTITITPVADDPRPQDDFLPSVPEDHVAIIQDADVLANDIEVDDEPLVARWLTPAVGTLEIQNGSASWTPPANFFGTTSLRYEACDSSGACVPAAVGLTVDPVNDRPALGLVDDLETAAGLAASITLAGQDVDDDDLVYSTSPLPAGLSLDPATGEIEGTVAPGQNGETFTITATVSDGELRKSRTFDITMSDIGLSTRVGQVGLTEVLYRQTGLFGEVDEFVEITNLTTDPLVLDGLWLQDFDPVDGRRDIEFYGFIPVDTSFRVELSGTLQPGESLVVWMTNPDTGGFPSAPSAQQLTLGSGVPLLDNDGDDLWLLDSDTNVLDFVAYDPGGPASQASTRPPAILDIWDATFEAELHGAAPGQSISVAIPGSQSDGAQCWELTASGDAIGRCNGAQATTADNANGDGRTASTALSNFS